MYEPGSAAGGVVATGVLGATGFALGQWWLLALAVALAAAGLLLIRFSSRKAIERVRLQSWDELDGAAGVDPHGWE